jgi:hypothetical protein
MKNQHRRSWETAWQKIADEDGLCRICGRRGVDPAHLWSRQAGGDESPENIVGLCREHHASFDRGDLDLIEFLRPEEKAWVVYLADQTQGLEGLEAARRRLRPSEYRDGNYMRYSPRLQPSS